jgi:hypothetical protein
VAVLEGVMATTLVGVLILVIFVWSCFRAPKAGAEQDRLRIDDAGIEYAYRDGVRRAEWPDISEVRIQTTDEGPFLEDVFFSIHTGSLSSPQIIVPHDEAVRGRLLEELQGRLRGLDDRVVIEAMGCCERRTFVIWRRPAEAAELSI